jgi:hypothetical protein
VLEYVVRTLTVGINVSEAQDNAFLVLQTVASLEKGKAT